MRTEQPPDEIATVLVACYDSDVSGQEANMIGERLRINGMP